MQEERGGLGDNHAGWNGKQGCGEEWALGVKSSSADR